MFYIAELNQNGGCDYTIECGTKIIGLDAKDKDAAIKEIESLLGLGGDDDDYDFGCYKNSGLTSITLYEVNNSTQIDVDAIYKKIEDAAKIVREEEAKKKRFKEFERLSKEFKK